MSSTTARPAPLASRSAAVRIALVLSLAVVLLGSVRFARFDWSGIPFDRQPATAERVVSDDCTERIRPYETDGGRVISPVVVDEQQYLSMVDLFRGTDRDDLHVSCLIDPFATRPAVPWLAHWLPFDEGVSIALVNVVMTLLATWATVFALRAQGHGARVVAAAGALFAIGWNTFFFSSVILIDAAALALVAVCWWLLAARRPWWIWPVLLVAYPVKETVAVLVLPVLAAWALQEHRAGRATRAQAVAPVAAAAVAAAASLGLARGLLLSGDATWPLSPNLGALVNNVFGPVGLASFLIATVPLYLPALVRVRELVRSKGRLATLLEPAVLGVALTAALCLWTVLAADLSPRFVWVGFPFAASLAAQWLSSGRPRERLDALRLPGWLLAE